MCCGEGRGMSQHNVKATGGVHTYCTYIDGIYPNSTNVHCVLYPCTYKEEKHGLLVTCHKNATLNFEHTRTCTYVYAQKTRDCSLPTHKHDMSHNIVHTCVVDPHESRPALMEVASFWVIPTCPVSPATFCPGR